MFATAEDLRRFLRRTTIDAAEAELVLELASETIRAEVAQQIDPVAADTYLSPPEPGRVLLLPELPVTDVASVTEYGQTLLAGTDYTWSSAGTVTRCGQAWPVEARAVVVTYDHGYADIPGQVRAVCLQLAARAYVNPQQRTSISIGDYSESFAAGGQGRTGRLEITPYEQRQLRGLRA